MRHVIVAFALLVGACAPQIQEAEPVTLGSAGSSSVGVSAEPLRCATDAQACYGIRAAATGRLGDSWTWSGACSPGVIWYGHSNTGRFARGVQQTYTTKEWRYIFNSEAVPQFGAYCVCGAPTTTNPNGAFHCDVAP